MFQYEKIIETKICKHCSANFDITDKDLEFYEKVSPSFWWKKYLIPPPTLCPDCRQQRRLSFRNERKLYKRKCDFSGKDIISMYSLDKPFKVYDQEIWWSDKWDTLDYWKDFDFGKSFFEQFWELIKAIPKFSLNNSLSENSDFCNDTRFNKNCYLIFWSDYSENSSYMWNVRKLKTSFDCNNIDESSLSYECMDWANLYNCFYCQDCFNCTKCFFSINCINSKNCLFCNWLNNAEYMIENKKYSKEEFDDILNAILSWSYFLNEKSKKYFGSIKSKRRVKNLNITNAELFMWDFLFNCKEVYNSFNIDDSENIKYVWFSAELKDSYDIYLSWWSWKMLYEDIGCWWLNHKILFSIDCRDSSSLMYSHYCYNSPDLFWCVGLRDKSYCILNKQYTREEYEKLVPKIIEHMKKTWEWWEFFPSSLSPFWYNETVAQEYFLLSKKESINWGFNWSNYESPKPLMTNIIPAFRLPDNIKDIPDDILNWAIECEITKTPFRITREELEFYRKYSLPIPRRHPDQRHLDRMKLRNPRKLFARICNKCGKDIQTTYAPEKPEIVYCEECYNKEIF